MIQNYSIYIFKGKYNEPLSLLKVIKLNVKRNKHIYNPTNENFWMTYVFLLYPQDKELL